VESAYVYLLGLYLGDGCISRSPRNVWRLRIFQDARYPGLIAACADAMTAVAGNPTCMVQRIGCVEVNCYWKHWTCVFPQHGAGRKHERHLTWTTWQRRLIEAHPRALVRGLIHSDGCRVTNRIRRSTRQGLKEYRYPRYFFTNASPEIRDLFAAACALVGVECRRTTERNLSVARRESVRLLDEFIGPKA
jgi:hypothetical protein